MRPSAVEGEAHEGSLRPAQTGKSSLEGNGGNGAGAVVTGLLADVAHARVVGREMDGLVPDRLPDGQHLGSERALGALGFVIVAGRFHAEVLKQFLHLVLKPE